MNKRPANKQDFFKTLSIICMFIDHFGLYLAPNHLYMRAMGRFAFPIFAFYAGYNFKNRVNLQVLIYGSLLYLYSTFFIFHKALPANILISIFVGQLYLFLLNRTLKSYFALVIHYFILIVGWNYTRLYFEYGSLTILFMIIGNLYKTKYLRAQNGAWQISFTTLFFSYVVFGGYFSVVDYLILAIVSISLFYIIKQNQHSQKIKYYFITKISRNSLIIYVIHLAIIQFVWRYC